MAEVETATWFFVSFVGAMMEAVHQKAVPLAAIYRLATAQGRPTLDKIVDQAYADWQAEQSKTGFESDDSHASGHPYRGGLARVGLPFSAPVVYNQPQFEELKRRFPAYVHPKFKNKRFVPIERCRTVSHERRELAFGYVHMGRDVSTDEVLATIDREGFRPALYEELLGFAERYPQEQCKFPIIALGSETDVQGGRHVACLGADSLSRNLGLLWTVGGWDSHVRFLVVRK